MNEKKKEDKKDKPDLVKLLGLVRKVRFEDVMKRLSAIAQKLKSKAR